MSIKVAFDIGGVLSKFPEVFRPLVLELTARKGDSRVLVYVISDMHPREKMLDMLARNGFLAKPGGIGIFSENVYSADYKTHGEACKAVLCRELGIDVLIDDFIGYVAEPGAPPVRLLVMPDSTRPYYHDDWLTDGSEGDFGRRNPAGSKRPPEGR